MWSSCCKSVFMSQGGSQMKQKLLALPLSENVVGSLAGLRYELCCLFSVNRSECWVFNSISTHSERVHQNHNVPQCQWEEQMSVMLNVFLFVLWFTSLCWYYESLSILFCVCVVGWRSHGGGGADEEDGGAAAAGGRVHAGGDGNTLRAPEEWEHTDRYKEAGLTRVFICL